MSISKSGYVYVLQMEGHPYYKIGRTVNLTRRLGEISPQMPGRLVVVMAHRVIDAWHTEALLHDNYHRLRLNGEWFRLSGNDIAEIKAHLLSEQGERLYHRLLSLITSDIYFELDHTRVTRALYHSAIRMDRRFVTYFNHASLVKPDQASTVHHEDVVLEAEVVG